MPSATGNTTPPKSSETPCLWASQLQPGDFYQANIMFPYTSTNSRSPSRTHLPADHGKNNTRPVLVVSVEGDIANILICSTTLNQFNLKRWVPFQGTTRYAGMSDAVVTADPADRMGVFGGGSVCMSHIFRTRPVVEKESGEPTNSLAPVISHMHPVKVTCTNISMLQNLHIKYWSDADAANSDGTSDERGGGSAIEDGHRHSLLPFPPVYSMFALHHKGSGGDFRIASSDPPSTRTAWEESDIPVNPFDWRGSEDEVAEAFKDVDVWAEEEDDDESDEGFDHGDEEEVLVFPTQFYPMDIACA